MITVNSRSFDGTIKRSWTCELVERKDPLLVFLGVFELKVDHPDLGLIEKGTKSYEFYWLDRWYNVFRFHTPDGELRNYYFNISMPPSFEGKVVNYVDLDIDIVVWPDLRYKVLDHDDHEVNSRRFGYPAEVNLMVEQTLDQLLDMISSGNLPDDVEMFAT